MAECLTKAVPRGTDFVARFGGEEFVAVLPNRDVSGAEVVETAIIKTMSKAMSKAMIPHCQSPVEPFVTVSIGIACRKFVSSQEIVALAQAALYRPKEGDRNRFVVG